MKRILLVCLAALCCVPASAQADSGSIISVTPSGDQFLGTYSVSVTVPTAYDYYGGYGYAWQVGPTEVCDPYNFDGRLVWVGELLNADAPDTQTGSDTFYANASSFKICLGINRASMGRILLAEQVFNAPAPPAAPTVPAVQGPATQTAPSQSSAPSAPSTDATACTYWSGQETKREKTMQSAKKAYSKAKKAYKKKRTSARRRAMSRARAKFNTAATKLKTAERKALAACT